LTDNLPVDRQTQPWCLDQRDVIVFRQWFAHEDSPEFLIGVRRHVTTRWRSEFDVNAFGQGSNIGAPDGRSRQLDI
jgi:hypothetical protein